MKPLVYYCRWQGAKLRLQGRDGESVWGHLVFLNQDGEEVEKEFNFLLTDSLLTLRSQEGDRQLWLDEMGVPQEKDS